MDSSISSGQKSVSTDYRRKIVGVEELRSVLAGLRDPARRGGPKTVVQCHGCFDIVHPGHIRYLQFARSQGDVLVVSTTGDAAIDKGDQRPYIPQELRAENLAALEFVDYVVIDPNETACELLAAIRPDIYVKGQEYATSQDPRFLAERRVVESHGGRVIFSSGQVVFSSSRLLESMAESAELTAERSRLVCRRHGIHRRSLGGLLQAMSRAAVVIVGDSVLERYVLCDASGVASESPMMSLVELGRQDYLGGAAQVAAQIAALGGRAILVTRLGAGEEGGWARQVLDSAGVELCDIALDAPIARRTRFVVDDHKVIKVDRVETHPMDSIAQREMEEVVASRAAGARVGLVYDGGQGLVGDGLWQRLEPLRRGGMTLLAGTAVEPRGKLQTLGPVDLLTTSERRLRAALNDYSGGLSTLAYRMLNDTKAKRMLVTMGKRGLVAFDRQSHDAASPAWGDRLRSEYIEAIADRVVDGLGCGETVLTAAALAMGCGASLLQAAYLATAAAAIQVGRAGARAVGVDELRRLIDQRPELAIDSEDHFRVRRGQVAAGRRRHEISPV